MRLIFTILLIGLFKANAQMVINASAPYRPLVSANPLLDDYPDAAAAYSLRKLRTAYSGSAIRVRKDTTGQPEQDIGFTASGDLDTAALKDFVKNNSGFVTTWYDQSGSGINAISAISTTQPRIVDAGTVERNNNKVAVRFDGSNDYLLCVSSTIFRNTGAGSVYSVHRYITNPTTTRIVYFASVGTSATTTRAALGGGSTSSRHTIIARRLDTDAASTLSGSTATNTTNMVSATAHFDWTNGDGFIYLNSSSEASNTSFTTNGNTSNTNAIATSIGAIITNSVSGTSVNNSNIHSFEIVIYNNIDNRSGIELNINKYYSIY